ncbi:MAG: Na(+)-translocating NADH-quinone reductase subunit F [Flavobacteriaceae bacterium]|jgi:hypothetical protein|nr:Na(+)-translocating NADH-quinone reductase subunit F [Flavobacteriaceae bacterium LSUCC0859]MCI4641705.1 Na(+)-translocating NADH-quinone reductase subunit F [Flavobacteriaceae bacterium]MCI5089111.1 Na(+)-translocating NADH-quinone reductase subunit F [Flavobacteriaceae bacterium]CAI8226925.1 MAG: Uncharacterised protein [SAR116 cluster bacterium]
MQELTEQELHNLAMNIVGKELQEAGYEFMAVNSTLKKHPQFVCLKDKDLHFILVRAVLYPNNPHEMDEETAQKMKAHADKFEAHTYYAGVGLHNVEDPSLPLYLDTPYTVTYAGLIPVQKTSSNE